MVLAGLGIFGASLFFGDSMITLAISALSAVEGLKLIEPSLESLIVPITAVIIVVMFAFQRVGTAAVGRLFGPVMIIWFLAIGACGIAGIVDHPEILRALSPTYALSFLVGTSRSRSSRWTRWCWRRPARRRCMPTWATSGARRSPEPGLSWCSRHAC
jgi:KUP system potassium uptake protein